ncbi:transposase [Flammeovirgaceae bacterium SG7u.111]|nr:transposase [Flammeovirgaceae bacterium SG7u.132]WPO36434.1 transposase [Flammeovirgaceae bacterium SG7u.111]
MSRKYKINDQELPYFVTFTVVNWIDVFIRSEFKDILLQSIKYCQENKGLKVHAWVIMTSHAHFILGTSGDKKLEEIIRDLKSFTSRHIRLLLEDKRFVGESRREWMLWMMKNAGLKNSNNKDFQLWQQHNHPIEISSEELLHEKLEYIHDNPVAMGFVESGEHWLYSSARDYYGTGKGLIDIEFLS